MGDVETLKVNGNILVNANGKCFLCLQSNAEEAEIKLDGITKIKQELDVDPPVVITGNVVSLLSILRYLKIKPGQIITTALEISNVKVVICNHCCPVVKELSNLCLELEVLQMKVEHQLKSFYGEMDISERDPERVHQFRTSFEEVEHLDLSETLRNKIMKKCSNKLNEILPKLTVEKMELSECADMESSDQVFLDSPASSSSPLEPPSPSPENMSENTSKQKRVYSYKCKLCPCAFSVKTSLNRHKKIHHSFAQSESKPRLLQRLTCHLCNLDFPTRPSYVKHVKGDCPHKISVMAHLKPKDRYECPLCRMKMKVSGTRSHKILHHTDTLLTSYRLPHLTQEVFKEYCDYVFQVELLLFAKKQNTRESGTLLGCSICSKEYVTHYSARYHLFLDHRHVMGKKLVELQKSTGLDEIRSLKLPSANFQYRGGASGGNSGIPGNVTKSGAPKRFRPNDVKPVTCKLCQPHRDVKARELRRHTIRVHVESLLTGSKAPNVSMTDFKLYCYHAFRMETATCQRVYDSRGSPGWKCCHCSRTLADEQNLHRHFFLDHRDQIERKIAELQKSLTVSEIRGLAESESKPVKWNCVKCGTGFAQECSLRRHLKRACKLVPKLPAMKPKCDQCGRSFRFPADLKRHVITVHSLSEGLKPNEETLSSDGVHAMKAEPCDIIFPVEMEESIFPDEHQVMDSTDDNEMKIVPYGIHIPI